MKILILLTILLLSTTSCSSLKTSSEAAYNAENNQLSEFIIGEWYSEQEVTNVNGTYLNEYKIKFISDNVLEFSMKSLYDGFTDKFHYQFIANKTLSVENERSKGGEWEINKDGEKLLICIWSNKNCLIFTKVNTK